MVKFMIHACMARKDYVYKKLIPSMVKQGIPEQNIVVWLDTDGVGCLKNFVRSSKYVKDVFGPFGGIWHLQDDVLISKNFAKRIRCMPENPKMVINGFVHKSFNPKEYRLMGTQSVKNYWMSFPCIYIPNRLMVDFYGWFMEEVVEKGKYARYYHANKYDDFFFWKFMKARHSDEMIFNCAPNLVNHIDYLLGGSQINGHHTEKTLAYYWDEPIPEKI